MNQQRIVRYRRQLQELRTRLRVDAGAVAEQARGPSGGQGDGALTNAPMHLGDEGTEEYLHDLNAALAVNEEYLATETRRALERMDAGTYGVCEDCGDPISVERLDAMPYTRYCTKCAAAMGAGLDVNYDEGRPRSPRDTLAPEGAMEEDWRTRPSALIDAVEQRTGAADSHAFGEAGGGTAVGGLAGSNEGHGDPAVSQLQDASANSGFDAAEGRDTAHREAPRSGRSGGAVGGTPARKRAK